MNSAQMAAFTFLTLCCLLWPGVLLKSIQISDQTNSLVKGTANVKTGHTSDFDYYVFTQQWPVSNCLTASSYDDCQIPANVSGWLIHGLWPSNFDGSYPAYCDDDYDFNDKEIEPIWGQLAKYWTNLYMDSAVDSFWEHEWDKHGTCAYTAHDMSSEFDYFNTTLGFHFDYPVGQWLLDAGISPDNSAIQNTSVINKVISDKVGKQTIFQCDYDQYKKEHIVNQIEICMDRNFKPIDCEESIENCNSDGKVLYPATVYHKNCDKTRENIKE
ncbi:ribonuclease Oy-like isoform X2 [Convolutriloba macropyga]|uniref:ribonuclease Oy-like isoform X2 n=1 Tax=Convolutriloba macropyga TaxID=536237 RepID=UPI003F520FA9